MSETSDNNPKSLAERSEFQALFQAGYREIAIEEPDEEETRLKALGHICVAEYQSESLATNANFLTCTCLGYTVKIRQHQSDAEDSDEAPKWRVWVKPALLTDMERCQAVASFCNSYSHIPDEIVATAISHNPLINGGMEQVRARVVRSLMENADWGQATVMKYFKGEATDLINDYTSGEVKEF